MSVAEEAYSFRRGRLKRLPHIALCPFHLHHLQVSMMSITCTPPTIPSTNEEMIPLPSEKNKPDSTGHEQPFAQKMVSYAAII